MVDMSWLRLLLALSIVIINTSEQSRSEPETSPASPIDEDYPSGDYFDGDYPSWDYRVGDYHFYGLGGLGWVGPGIVREPDAAFGFFALNETYQGEVAPDETNAMAWMEPTFVTEIDSMTRQMGIEVKMRFMWEDARIFWKKEDEMVSGSSFGFDPSILE